LDKCLQPGVAPKIEQLSMRTRWRWRRRAPKHVGEIFVAFSWQQF